MRWRDAVTPEPMTRLALVTPAWAVRDALVEVADAGTVDLDRGVRGEQPVSEAAQRLQRLPASQPAAPRLCRRPPDLAVLERDGRSDLLAGEAELAGYTTQAVVRGDVAALLGWVPTARLADLVARLGRVDAAAAALPVPRGVQPPTAPRPGVARRTFGPLVDTYATVPYADIDPSILAGLAYVVMFGAMFGDVGHGLLLVLLALLIRFGRLARLTALRPHWLFVAGAGLSAALFGFAYGEFFGPTGVVPVGWLSPMDQPEKLLIAGIGLGAVLLAGAYALGTVNRVREGGWALGLYAPSGFAGSLLFLAAGLAAVAWYADAGWAWTAAIAVAVLGLVLAFIGLLTAAGGGAAGVLQAAIELVDLVIRLGANVVSFARLAAFGLTHAVLGWIVWRATVGLWHVGPLAALGAIVVFVVGNALAFALEALVAGVQALRLEYYELFSRVFQTEGREFQPWHVPVDATPGTAEEAP